MQFDYNTRAGYERINGVAYSMEETQMQGNAVLQSRRFWTFILSIVTSLVLYFGAKYFNAYMEDIKVVIVAVSAVATFLILAYTYNDVQDNKNAAAIEIAQINAAK